MSCPNPARAAARAAATAAPPQQPPQAAAPTSAASSAAGGRWPASGGATPPSAAAPLAGRAPARRCRWAMWACSCGSATPKTRCRARSRRSSTVRLVGWLFGPRCCLLPTQGLAVCCCRVPPACPAHPLLPPLSTHTPPGPNRAGAFYAAVRDFVMIIVVAAPLFALTDYVDQCLAVAWRRWLTRKMIRCAARRGKAGREGGGMTMARAVHARQQQQHTG